VSDEMNRVFKYRIPAESVFFLSLPVGAEVLAVQAQHDEGQLWALVDPAAPTTERCFEIAGTGQKMADLADDVERRYVGTWQVWDGAYVFHLFELGQLDVSADIGGEGDGS
jgi:hypothetical protein